MFSTVLTFVYRSTTPVILLAATICSAGAVCTFAQQTASPVNATSYPVVPNGTRFLIGLDEPVGTAKNKVNDKFKARTLEPLAADNGSVVAPGAEIRGHISRIEPAGLTGHARLWLTFDDIKTPAGWRPVIATVISVPGDFSVKQEESKEGEIEGPSSNPHREAEAAAAGAALGATVGSKTGGAKGAAMGAATGAAAGFLASSGVGQELDLVKGTKVEIELTRPLYVTTPR
jgi:hypothetical protein